jgi:transcription antitermination factor NusG
VVLTEPRAQQVATDALRARGHDVIFAKQRIKKRRHGRTTATLVPLFDNYLLVEVPTADGWRQVFECRGVVAVLMNNGRPLYAPHRL